MTYNQLKLHRYPKFQRGSASPGAYNENLLYQSQHLKEDSVFPVTSDDPDLERLGHELGRRLGELHTSLGIPRKHLDKVRVVPDSGTLAEGVAWLLPHLKPFNCVSLDTESCTSLQHISFVLFGSVDGHVLIVDYRKLPDTVFPQELRPLVEGRLVIGSRIAGDAKLLRGIEYRAGEVQKLSSHLQHHPLYPYRVPNSPGPGRAGIKTGLKFIPEMIYGHHYGPLSSTWKGGDQGRWILNGYAQPFDWPDWLYPSKFYRFGSSPPRQEQLAYMKNDACSPHIHVLLLTMLNVAEGKVKSNSTINEAIQFTIQGFFGQPPDVETGLDVSGSVPALTIKHPPRRTRSSGWAPDVWAESQGIPPGVSDAAMLDALAYLPAKVLKRMSNYLYLDPTDDDDNEFVELYGGLQNVTRAARLIKEQDLLCWDDKKSPMTDTAKQTASSSSSLQSRLRSLAHTSPRRGRSPIKCRERERSNTRSRSARRPKSAESEERRDTKETKGLKTRKSRSPPKPTGDPVRKRPLSQHKHTSACKRQRVVVNVWRCPGSSKCKVEIPEKYLLDETSPRGHTAGKRVARGLRRSDSSSSSSSTSSDSSSESSDSDDSESIQAATSNDSMTPDGPGPDPDHKSEPERLSPRIILPEEVPEDQRNLLLRGELSNVILPDCFAYPARFGDQFDVGHRCSRCGHRQNPAKPWTCHPVLVCPVLQEHQMAAVNYSADVWPRAACFYPLCADPGSHFTQMCPELHALCLKCCRRGHSMRRCDLISREHSEEALASYYKVFWTFGIRSRKRDVCPEWNFRPRLPSFRLVSSSKKHYLLPWTAQELEKFYELDSTARYHKAQAELYK